MNDTSRFDEARAHRFFSAECFNRTWNLIEKARRAPEEDEQMRLVCHASLWHWTQREDCKAENLSIGCWQLSRVYALLGHVREAIRYGEMCLHHSRNEAVFYLGYAHEAIARAAMVDGDNSRMMRHLNEARQYAAQVTDPEDRETLGKDLNFIQSRVRG